ETLRLHSRDDGLVARAALARGTRVEGGRIELPQEVPAGHKIAARAIAKGEPVRRYGQVIGFASRAIEPGEHVHTHNLHIGELKQDHAVGTDLRPVEILPPERQRTFEGFLRADGRVGTRNYVAIVSTVNCSASVSKLARDRRWSESGTGAGRARRSTKWSRRSRGSCPWRTRRGAPASPPPTWCSAPTAAGPTVTPASPPTPRWAGPPTS